MQALRVQSEEAASLLELARRSEECDRTRLYQGIVHLVEARGEALSEVERGLMVDIMRRIAHHVEMSVRLNLAERLAARADAPHDLILLLANDEIEIARPVLELSPILTEEDLVTLVNEQDEPHRATIAGRPHIGPQVAHALIARGGERALLRLVANPTAQLSQDAFARLVATAGEIEALREPLAQRSDLPRACAERLVPLVGAALREHILRAFALDPASLAADLAQAEAEVRARPFEVLGDDAAAARLVLKLQAAGQLTSGFLVKSASNRQYSIFEHGAALALELPLGTVRRILYDLGPVPVALACRALRIDRAVYPQIQRACAARRNQALPVAGDEHAAALKVLADLGQDEARQRLATYADA